ncbi:hexokinase [Dendrosporobacter sp. 1207_IL3150]|uniref:hexokinase n=1 Tax=Dendrosporobacter sp. 1207_IL3150 TaxID=3084054 RepID=UPI002FDA8CB2
MTFDVFLARVYQAFTVTTEQLFITSRLFDREISEGLANKPSSLAMLPSYLTKPTGHEQGIFLALDFGGTNVRALLVELKGCGKSTILSRVDSPLIDPDGYYDYTLPTATACELFDFLADKLSQLTQPTQEYPLGHAFSFPFRMTDQNNAVLLYWTKEIATADVVGNNIVNLLNDAFARKGISNIKSSAILNDSVSALMAAAYQDNRTDIGSICGTGHNTCYLEPNPPWSSGRSMYINMESGNFNKVPENIYDRLLDEKSDRPGAYRLEKMCSGRYIGELLRLVMLDLIANKALLSNSTAYLDAYSLTGKDLNTLLTDTTPHLESIAQWLNQLGYKNSSLSDRTCLQKIAALITRRSARLAASTYAATLLHIDPELKQPHVIAIDGSLYEKIPGYANTIKETLSELLGTRASKITCELSQHGSGIGAAVAAATTLSLKRF